MKKIPSILLLTLLVGIVAVLPTEAFAKRGSDDTHEEKHHDDKGRHGKHHDDDDFINSSSTSRNQLLEIEADVFTDITIVKIEFPTGKKLVFETTAETEAEVVDEIISKTNLTETEIEAVIDFEIEDRASRTKERAKITGQSNSTNTDQNQNLREQITKLEQLIELLLAKLAAQNI